MKLEIKQAKELSEQILLKTGFDLEQAQLTTENLIEAELAGKKTHGLVRLLVIKERVKSKVISLANSFQIINETANSLYLETEHQLGIPAIYKSLEIALQKVKETKICCVGLLSTRQ